MRIVQRAGYLAGLVAGAVLLLATAAGAAPTTYAVIDNLTGELIASDGADVLNQPASLTKMMTLYMTFEALRAGRLDMATRLPVSARAAAMRPSKLGVKPGTTIRVDEAIQALIIKSANDVAVVLAEALGGSEERFALLMTRAARQKGMTRTTFRNASGWPDERQLTTARDMATLGRRLVADFPEYYPYFSREYFIFRGRRIPTHNGLMLAYDGMDGLKTGYTQASGYNLASSAVRNGRRLVGAVLGGRSSGHRNLTMAGVLDDAFKAMADRPVLVAAAPTPRATLAPVAVAALAEREETAAEGDADPAHYAIQVGAFGDRAAARKAAGSTAARLASLEGRAVVGTGKGKRGKTLYLARVAGLSADDARDGCASLKRIKQPCFVLRTESGG